MLDDLKEAKPLEISPYISSTDFHQISNYEIGNVWLGRQSMDEACDRIAKRVDDIIQRNINNPYFIK